MAKTSQQISREIAALQQALQDALAEEAVIRALPFNQQMAIILHTNRCRANHTDGCGWYYEIDGGKHNFKGGSHEYWLRSADKTIERLATVEPELTPVRMLNIVEAITAS